MSVGTTDCMSRVAAAKLAAGPAAIAVVRSTSSSTGMRFRSVAMSRHLTCDAWV